MVKIEAIIRPQKLEAVQDALTDLGIDGLTAIEVKGSGKQKGSAHTYRGSQYTLNLTPKVKLEVVVAAAQVDAVTQAIRDAASTGEVGDGKIFVYPLADAMRIRTGERGDAAIS